MKYFKIFILVAVVALLAYACKKSFLDKAPIGQLLPSSVANANAVQGLLIGAYSELDGIGDPNANYGSSSGWASSADDWIFGGLPAGEAHKGSSVGDQPEIVPIESYHALSTNPNTEGRWDLVYDGVSRSNDVIRGAAAATDIDPADLPVILGQARALRAWYHFDAKKHWNNIPFVDETVTYVANNYFVGNTDDAWPKIEADLQFAVANLPVSFSEPGRINKYTAEAILAKVYMFEGKYSDAKPLLQDIINSGVYTLNDRYHDNFSVITKNSQESVFAAQSSVNDGSGGNNGNYGVTLNFPYGPAGTCCGFDQPSQWLVDHFKTDANGLPDLDNFDAAGTGVTNDMGKLSSDPFTPYAGTLDPRLDWTVGRRGLPYYDWGIHPGNDWIRAQTDGGPYAPKKNVTYKSEWSGYTDASFWQAGTTTALNVNLIRYADVLLWYAEIQAQPGGDLDSAEAYVNIVRNRMVNNHQGWLHKYLVDSLPQNGFYTDDAHLAANYKIAPYPPGAFAAGGADFANKAIRFERLLELGMEGHRFFDIVRWKIAKEEITRYLSKESALGISYIQNVSFTPGKNEYFPIPQTEIDKSNGALKQNPGY